jgi:hypothetical protein
LFQRRAKYHTSSTMNMAWFEPQPIEPSLNAEGWLGSRSTG